MNNTHLLWWVLFLFYHMLCAVCSECDPNSYLVTTYSDNSQTQILDIVQTSLMEDIAMLKVGGHGIWAPALITYCKAIKKSAHVLLTHVLVVFADVEWQLLMIPTLVLPQ